MNALTAMPTYSTYRKTNVDWIQQIPTAWEVKKIKHVSTIVSGDSLAPTLKEKFSDDAVEGRPYVASKDINVRNSNINYDNGLVIPKCASNFKLARKDSSLICIEGGSAGKKIAYVEKDICYVNKLACLQSKHVENKFLFYSLFSEPFQSQFKSSLTGLIGGVSISSISNFSLPIPSTEEQKKIVRFLDGKISHLHEVISAKEKQIELFKERKKIIIRKAVTQGLDFNVSMRDSGVEWLGCIPVHWKTVRFKNLFSQSRLPVRKSDGVVTSYRDGEVTLRSNRRLDGYTEAILEGGYQGVRAGQLVLNSMDAFEGAIGVSDSDGKCTPEYVICDPRMESVSQYYFAFLLREMALAKYIQVICNAVRQRAVRIRFNNLASLFMILPPKEEQDLIVEHVKCESTKIDNAVKQLEEQIDKIREYKATLINSAVTGKIKVA